jgi:hypothetical protein
MQKKTTAVALLAVAMLAAGCGGPDLTVNEQSNLATREDDSRAYSYEIEYFDEMGNHVGTRVVPCSGPILMYGTTGAYAEMVNEQQCSYGGYECPPPTYVCF